MESLMDRKRLFNIFIIVFIDLLGFGLILPLLPFYADEFGASPTLVGLLTASYAAAQLLGAPVLGRLSDRYGRRPVLLVSIFGTFVSLLLLGLAEPVGRWLAANTGLAANTAILGVLFFSRILDGLTGGNISVAQAYITDVTDAQSRARGLGLLGAAFGLGFIMGPAIGGALSTWGFAVPAFAAAGLAALNLLSVFFWLPESLTLEQRRIAQERERTRFSARALWQALNRPRVGPLLHIRFFFGLAFAMFQTVFPLFAQYRLELDARQTGFVLAYVGVLAALVQGVAIGALARRFAEHKLIFASTAIMAVALLAWAFTPNVPTLLVLLLPLAFAGGTLNTVINSALTKAVYSEEVGGTLGLSASVESLTRVIAPSLGGYLLGSLGTWAPGVLSAVVMGWVVSFAWRRIIINPDPPLPDRDEFRNSTPILSMGE
ncbi:MAG: MFS transporter [Anaerolineales bacterium]|nr:MFS transporter [Anaerolineales bacterium]